MAERVSVMHHNIDGTERLIIPVRFTSKIEEDMGILCVYPVYRMYLVTQQEQRQFGGNVGAGAIFKKLAWLLGTPAIMDPKSST